MPILSSRLAVPFFTAAAAVLIPGSKVAAQPAAAHPSAGDTSPFLGEWELDLSRMPDSYGAAPRRVLYTFKEVGAGQWRTEIDITGTDGNVRHMAAQYRRDGAAVPGEGETAEADSAAINSPSPNILVMSLAKNRTLSSVRVFVVSADGTEMTEAAANVNENGAPFVRNFRFRRVR